jgi:hypothetical protein
MQPTHRLFLSLAALFFVVLSAATAAALDPGPDGWYVTGEGVRTKKVVLVNVKVYRINHATKQLPPTKSKQAMIDLDADKRFKWTMLRDVDHDKIQSALKEAYGLNGYGDSGKINSFMGAFTHALKENTNVTISYDSTAKATTIKVDGDGTVTVPGVDFMKGTWSIWFGKIDQSDLGDALISKM